MFKIMHRSINGCLSRENIDDSLFSLADNPISLNDLLILNALPFLSFALLSLLVRILDPALFFGESRILLYHLPPSFQALLLDPLSLFDLFDLLNP